MNNRHHSFRTALVTACLSLGAFGLYNAGANSRSEAPAPAPAAIATVNVEKLMAGLAEKKMMDETIAQDYNKKQGDLDAMSAKLKKLNDDLDLMNKESIEYRNKRAEIYELSQHAKSTQSIYREVINLAKGDVVKAMYDKITPAVAKVAEKDGYTLVLLDDRTIELPKAGPEGEMSTFILNKRILYAAPSVDITDRIITEMNNEYSAPAARPKK